MSGRIAEEIRARLARNNVTKSELARRLNVSHTWVTNRLIGNQEIGTTELQRIADALGVSYGDLLPRQARESSLSWKIPATKRARHSAVRTIVPATAEPLTGRATRPNVQPAKDKSDRLAEQSTRRLYRIGR